LDPDSVAKSFDSRDAKVVRFVFWNRSLIEVAFLEVNVFDIQLRVEGSAISLELTNSKLYLSGLISFLIVYYKHVLGF